MQEFQIEVNGKVQTVSLEQLRMLVSRRFIKPEAIARVGGEEFTVAEIIAQSFAGGNPNALGVPVSQTSVPRTGGATPDFGRVDVPSSQNATPKKSRKALVAGIIGLVMIVGSIAVFALFYFGGEKKSKPAAEEGTKPPVSQSEVENKSDFSPEEANSSKEEDDRSKENETEEIVNDESDSSEDGKNGEEPFARGWEPFDRSWEIIPETYNGEFFPELYSDISERYDEIEKQRSQGEFETSEEYHSRMERDSEKFEQELIKGNIHFGSTIGFPLVSKNQGLQSSSFNTVDTQYDPDKKNWTITVKFEGTKYGATKGASSFQFLVPISSYYDSERYAAVNGFNTKFEVLKSTYEDYGACVEFDDMQESFFRSTFPLSVTKKQGFVLNNVPLEFAKENKGKISGYCVCDIEFKKPFYDYDYDKATFSSPYESTERRRYIFVKNLEFWFYDETTRMVVAKFSLEEALTGKAKSFTDAKIISEMGILPTISSGASNNAESTNSTVGQYALTPFVGDDLRVPVDYRGNDLVAVSNALSRTSFRIPSTDFSSPDEYRKWLQQRANSLASESLYGSLTFNSKLAYVMRNAAEADGAQEVISTEYQESTKTMTIRRSFKYSRSDYKVESSNSKGGFGGGGFGALFNRYNSNNTSESVPDVFFSLCMYGGKAYGLALENSQIKKRSEPQFDHWTLTEVSRGDYNRLKDSIRVLCVFQLGANGSEYSGFYESSDSTLTYPSCALCTVNPEFWLYDGKTGAILAKYKAEEFFNGRRIALSKTVKEALSRLPDGTDGDLGEEFATKLEPPTWDDVLGESVDSPESWESKKPTVTVPDDAASLEEALAKSSKGDVILVRSTEKPIPLKGKKAARGESSEVLIDHAVAIVGESGASGDVVVEVGSEETLRIDSRDLVAFKGLTFSFRNTPSADAVTPLVAVSNDSKAKFKNCVFEGNGAEKSTGVVVEGEFASVSFWKCQFQQFGDAGLRVQDSSKATLEYCQFLSENRYGVSSFSGASAKVDKCRFDGNVTGFIAEGGGGVVASNSFFSGNRSNWSISSGSRDACDTKEGNVIEK